MTVLGRTGDGGEEMDIELRTLRGQPRPGEVPEIPEAAGDQSSQRAERSSAIGILSHASFYRLCPPQSLAHRRVCNVQMERKCIWVKIGLAHGRGTPHLPL